MRIGLKKRIKMKKMSKSIIPGDEQELTIRKGKLNSLNIYEITEDELDKLETGGSEPIFLNFAIFLLSIALSFLIALITTTMKSRPIFDIFVIIVGLGFILGIILLILWWKSRHSIKGVINKIRERLQEKIN